MDIPRKNAKRQRRIRQALYGVAGLVVVTSMTFGLSRLQPAAPSVDRRTLWIDAVKRGSMLRQVRGVGSLVSEDILLVPAGVSGRVTRILVEPGTTVEADTVILELSNPELELELLNAESQLSSARAKLTAQKVSLEDQLLGMGANLTQLEANYNEAKLKAEVDQKQFDDELISELNLTLSLARVDNLEKLVEVNKKRLALFRDQTIPAQLAELEAAIRQAQSLYKLKQSQVDSLHVCTGKPGVLAQVKDRVEPGQQVAQGTILAKITDPKRLKARLKIPEVQARDIRIGLKAEIDTYNGKIPGNVSRIDPTVMEGNVTVDVTLDGALPDGARPDLSVVGTVEIERLEDILFVGRPVFASSESAVELFKLVEEGDYAIRSRAQLGRSSVSTIEVLEGLTVGDEIILSDMSQWDDHDRLRLK